MAKYKLREGVLSFTDPSQSLPENRCISGKQIKELQLTSAVANALKNKVLVEIKEVVAKVETVEKIVKDKK